MPRLLVRVLVLHGLPLVPRRRARPCRVARPPRLALRLRRRPSRLRCERGLLRAFGSDTGPARLARAAMRRRAQHARRHLLPGPVLRNRRRQGLLPRRRARRHTSCFPPQPHTQFQLSVLHRRLRQPRDRASPRFGRRLMHALSARVLVVLNLRAAVHWRWKSGDAAGIPLCPNANALRATPHRVQAALER